MPSQYNHTHKNQKRSVDAQKYCTLHRQGYCVFDSFKEKTLTGGATTSLCTVKHHIQGGEGSSARVCICPAPSSLLCLQKLLINYHHHYYIYGAGKLCVTSLFNLSSVLPRWIIKDNSLIVSPAFSISGSCTSPFMMQSANQRHPVSRGWFDIGPVSLYRKHPPAQHPNDFNHSVSS